MMPAYFRPKTLGEALKVRAERPVTVLAGGTDVYPARTARMAWGDMRHADILDISAVRELAGIAETDTHIRLGALVTWAELRRAALPPAFAGYQLAARDIGGAQVQNRGTLVGNICTASPAGDGIPCLFTLDAEIGLASLRGRRAVPFAEFVGSYRHTVCADDEIVTEIRVPRPDPAARGHFLKLGARRYLVISIAMVAGVVATAEDGLVTSARVAVGACSPVARRLPLLENALQGQPLAAAPDIVSAGHLASLQPIDDVRASGTFRRAAALDMVRDLLADLVGEPDRRAA